MSVRSQKIIRPLSIHSATSIVWPYNFGGFDGYMFTYKAFAQSKHDIIYTVLILVYVQLLLSAIYSIDLCLLVNQLLYKTFYGFLYDQNR